MLSAERFMKTRLLPLAVLLCLTAGFPAAGAAEKQGVDAAFKALYLREWQWRKAEFPDVDDSPIKPIVDHLPKVDAASQAKRLSYWLEVMTALEGISRNALSPSAQTDYDVYRPQIQVLIDNERFRDYEMPANSDSSFWSGLGETADKP